MKHDRASERGGESIRELVSETEREDCLSYPYPFPCCSLIFFYIDRLAFTSNPSINIWYLNDRTLNA